LHTFLCVGVIPALLPIAGQVGMDLPEKCFGNPRAETNDPAKSRVLLFRTFQSQGFLCFIKETFSNFTGGFFVSLSVFA